MAPGNKPPKYIRKKSDKEGKTDIIQIIVDDFNILFSSQ